MSSKPTTVSDKQTIVLRTKLMPQEIMEIINKKKTSFFGSALRRPKFEEIQVETPILYLEQVIHVAGYYEIDFNRNVVYEIKVEPDVKEVTIGHEKFPISNPSGIWENFGKKMKQGVGMTKQELKIKATENAMSRIEDSMYVDNNNLETEFGYSINSDSIENYAQKTLELNKEYVRRIEVTEDEIFERFADRLKSQQSSDIEIINDEYVISEYSEIFIPIYEARCFDQNEKTVIIRIDALTGKIF